MGRSGSFKVGKYRGRWCVNIAAGLSDTGKRKRITYNTQREARAAAEIMRIEQLNKLNAAQVSLPSRLDAQRALGLLAPHGATLTEAARLYVRHMEAVAASVRLGEVIDRFLAEPKQRDASEAHRGKFETMRRRYAGAFGEKTVEEITPEDIVDVLEPIDTASTWNGHRRYLNVLFAYAVKRGLCTTNPVARTDSRKEATPRRAIFTPDQAELLMRAAESYEDGTWAPYFAVCLFAGLRPVNEASGLLWGDVDLEGRHIYVRPETGKRDRDRYAEISDNLAAWLHRRSGARVTPHDYRDNQARLARQAIREAAGVPWDNDIMRHSFCSYWIAEHNESGRLCEIAGHSVEVSLKHYRRAVKPADAAKFWAIRPLRSP